MTGENGKRKSVRLQAVDAPPVGAPMLDFQGPFVAEKGADTDYVCGKCGVIIAGMPGSVRLSTETGAPVVLVCYACGALNLAP